MPKLAVFPRDWDDVLQRPRSLEREAATEKLGRLVERDIASVSFTRWIREAFSAVEWSATAAKMTSNLYLTLADDVLTHEQMHVGEVVYGQERDSPDALRRHSRSSLEARLSR